MVHEDLETLLAPVVADFGCNLWACEYLSQGSHSMVRIYIDKEQGVTVDDCANVSREASPLLDVNEEKLGLRGHYTLEVSSPGLDRPLFKAAHFRQALGQKAVVRLHAPLQKRRKLSGTLLSLDDENNLTMQEVTLGEIQFSLKEVAKANIVANGVENDLEKNDTEHGENHE